jgi:hypothetical protein
MRHEEDQPVDIEAIMREVRSEILRQKSVTAEIPSIATSMSGKRFPPELYEHLYRAALVYDVSGMKLHLTESSVPIIGSLVRRLRQKLHELVLFYVNKLATNQTEFNKHLFSAVSILVASLESDADGETLPPNRQMR